jgi:NNP family nitrate/nitrite transporter-like MFS transporter
MANIDAFYPQRLKGWALGLNAGGGNIGVAAVQLMGLAVLGLFGAEHPRALIAIYVPLVVLSTVGAAYRMDNLVHVRNEHGAMREVLRERHSWIIMGLYVGSFGSFIGFGFAFGQVLQVQFAGTFDTPVKAASVTFIGPLIGSLIRPVGGRMADRRSGSSVTLSTFIAMAAAATVVRAASGEESLLLFVIGFVALFVLSGVANGSTYKMIPAIFNAQARRRITAGTPADDAEAQARRMSRALIGIAGAVGAFGGVLVNLSFREAFLSSGSGDAAYATFVGLYALCALTTWGVYRRPASRIPGV